ncbi:hypothetical protein MED121_12275 [Marinomonas sp. MED121]|nr:hypothetical protein MED121_12275 [Marinomonas sp. MED121]
MSLIFTSLKLGVVKGTLSQALEQTQLLKSQLTDY